MTACADTANRGHEHTTQRSQPISQPVSRDSRSCQQAGQLGPGQTSSNRQASPLLPLLGAPRPRRPSQLPPSSSPDSSAPASASSWVPALPVPCALPPTGLVSLLWAQGSLSGGGGSTLPVRLPRGQPLGVSDSRTSPVKRGRRGQQGNPPTQTSTPQPLQSLPHRQTAYISITQTYLHHQTDTHSHTAPAAEFFLAF